MASKRMNILVYSGIALLSPQVYKMFVSKSRYQAMEAQLNLFAIVFSASGGSSRPSMQSFQSVATPLSKNHGQHHALSWSCRVEQILVTAEH